MVKAVIFDFDDTLVKTKDVSFVNHEAIGRHFGYHLSKKSFAEHYGKPWPTMIGSIFPGLPFSVFYNELMKREGDYPFQEIEGASEILHYLQEGGIILGILTSDLRESFIRRATRLGYLKYFDSSLILCADDTPHQKPDGRVFLPLLKSLHEKGVRLHECLFVGDHFVDYEAAKTAGVPFFAVTTGFKTIQDFMAAGLSSDCILSTVADLKQKMFSEVFP